MIDRLNGIRIVSNYGVGVDHINVKEVVERGIPVGNTPGVLNGATADMGMARVERSVDFLLACERAGIKDVEAFKKKVAGKRPTER